MKIKIIALISCLGMLGSCDYLDYEQVYPTEKDYVYKYNIAGAINSVYGALPRMFNWIDNAMLASASDEAEHANEFSNIQYFNTGNWGPYSNPDDAWSRLYAGIRKADLFLAETVNVTFEEWKITDPEGYEKRVADLVLYRAEARFLKAFFYFELSKRYGDVTILKRAPVITDNLNVPRNSYMDVVSLIINECNAALKALPVVRTNEHLGRATKGACYALKARTFIYAASPLHNNGLYNQELCDSAAQNANELFKLTPGTYNLHSNYGSLFRSGTSKEIIFEGRVGNTNSFEIANFPIGYEGANGNATCPSQNLVDAYEMKTTGLPITDPDSGYDSLNPYFNRDPRLALTVLLNNTFFKGRPVECWTGGLDGQPKNMATKTGYYLLKITDANVNLLTGTARRHTWMYFRLGEMYLNYAEAMNEILTDPYAAGPYNLSVADALNKIRARAGMPNVKLGLTQSQMKDLIRNERQIELAFEEHRFWDVRRWMIAESTLGAPLIGMRITKNIDNTFTYNTFEVEKRSFNPKMYYYPIPQIEVYKTPKVGQNEGW